MSARPSRGAPHRKATILSITDLSKYTVGAKLCSFLYFFSSLSLSVLRSLSPSLSKLLHRTVFADGDSAVVQRYQLKSSLKVVNRMFWFFLLKLWLWSVNNFEHWSMHTHTLSFYRYLLFTFWVYITHSHTLTHILVNFCLHHIVCLFFLSLSFSLSFSRHSTDFFFYRIIYYRSPIARDCLRL